LCCLFTWHLWQFLTYLWMVLHILFQVLNVERTCTLQNFELCYHQNWVSVNFPTACETCHACLEESIVALLWTMSISKSSGPKQKLISCHLLLKSDQWHWWLWPPERKISDFHRALKSSMMFNIPKFHMIWCFLEHKWSMFKTRQQQSWLWRSPLAAVPHVGKHLKRKSTTRVYMVMTMHAVKVVCVHYVKHWHNVSPGYKFDSMMWGLTFMSARPG
jgi:hypothetical protein